jgi:hypothetical protein
LGLAVAELKRIGNELLPLLREDSYWPYHAGLLNHILAGYRSFLNDLSFELESTSHAVARAVILATMNIAWSSQTFGHGTYSVRIKQTSSKYAAERHYGIEYILLLQLLQSEGNPDSLDVEELLESRQNLVSQIAGIIPIHDYQTSFEHFKSTTGVDLVESQLFLPRELFQIPALVKAIKQDGRRDLLGRSVGHMLYDNEVVNELSHEITNGSDVLGRTRLHLICITGRCEQRDTEMVSTLETWAGDKVLGLYALYLAAIHGNMEVLRLARVSHHSLASDMLTEGSYDERSGLHWAAAYGHLECVEYLSKVSLTSEVVVERLLVQTDRFGDSALDLAAQHGRIRVVEFILQHTDREEIMRACRSHTPFWAAVRGRHLNIMKLLELISDVDPPKLSSELSYATTPLAEAARQGFLEGVEYLLDIQNVDINRRHCSFFSSNRTPLDFAISGGHLDCVEFMRARGAFTWKEIEENRHNDDDHNRTGQLYD